MAKLIIDMDRDSFEPGESVEVRGSWELDTVPSAIELRLIWFTSGTSQEDVAEVATCEMEPTLRGSEKWHLQLPNEPYSFHGKLFQVNWALELLVDGGEFSTECRIVIGPGGRAVS